jgi:hypothetical protein
MTKVYFPHDLRERWDRVQKCFNLFWKL